MARRVPVKLQDSLSECGAACLAMILGHFGVRATVRDVDSFLFTGRDGASAKALVDVAERKYGLHSTSYSADVKDLETLQLPAILHWDFGHFVVLEKVRGDIFYIIDPRSGRRRVHTDDVSLHFTGIVLCFSVDQEWRVPNSRNETTLGYLISQIPAGRHLFFPFLLVSLLVLALGLLPALFTRYLIDAANVGDIASSFGTVLWAILVFILCNSVSYYARGAILIQLKTRMDISLVASFVKRMFGLPFRYFQNRGAGDLLTRTSSTTAIRDVLSVHILTLLLDLISGILYVLLLIFIFPIFGFVALGVMFFQCAFAILFTPLIKAQSELKVNALSASQGSLAESISGIASIKASGGEEYAYHRWEENFSRQMWASIREERLQNLMASMFEVSRIGVPLILVLVGVYSVLGGDVTLGTMVAANGLVGMAMAPINSISHVYQSLQTIGVHVSRIQDVRSEPIEQSGNSAKRIPQMDVDISLDGVGFNYQRSGPPVLDDITLRIPVGSSVAIVGSTGSGKSTLGHLIIGLHLPTSGELWFDGVGISEIDVPEFRKQFGAVLQDCSVYSGSIFENIALNSPDATIAEVSAAAEAACLGPDLRSMPLGYETPLGEGGSGISGGQKQRLALARALIAQPKLILLDEATSHLDVATEKQIQENLKNLGCTRIIIAHRLSTVEDADQIVFLDRGRVLEIGHHSELMERGGHYFAMVSGSLRIESHLAED